MIRVAAQGYDYRLSHVAPTKGASYDASFTNTPWRAYLWDRERRVLDRVLDEHFAGRAIRHLDFACGTGRILGYLHGRTTVSVGVDLSQSMLDVARRKVPEAELVCADITREDALGERSFDLITAFRFFPNAQAQLREEAIAALAARLAPGGLLVFNNHKNHSSLLYLIGRLVGKRPMTMSLGEVQELSSRANLEVVDRFAIGALPATDKHMLMPGWVHRLTDGAANVVGLAPIVAQDVIYACRPKASPLGDALAVNDPQGPDRERSVYQRNTK